MLKRIALLALLLSPGVLADSFSDSSFDDLTSFDGTNSFDFGPGAPPSTDGNLGVHQCLKLAIGCRR